MSKLHCVNRVSWMLVLMILLPPAVAAGQSKITTPKEQFGFNLGDDYCLANYTQLVDYWRKLEGESDRMRVEVIGKTEEGRDMLMAIITSPKNHKQLDHFQNIARRLALAEGLDDNQARRLAARGKAVVWIDGGLHASEVLVAQQLMETVFQLVSLNDAETLRFLNDVIVLFCCPNPDGLDLVADWYMRHSDPQQRFSRSLPRLYQKYTGHDNNRDFYMVTQKETEAVCRVFYHAWFPQIVYNHHQSGPSGTVLFAPPFRDPYNHNFDALVPIGIDLVGAAMHGRFIVEGKPGATMRKGASYSTWWNGGLRTNVYFHNMIGLLTETVGHPTPMSIPLRLRRQLATADLPYPIAPQKWHFRQSVDYSVTANRAVIDVASRHREQFLFNIYRMGKNSIERGNRDHWTIRPRRIAVAQKALDARRASASENTPAASAENGDDKPPDIFKEILHDPQHRDPRGYIIPSDQPDFLTATKFVNALIKNGITIHRATGWFAVGDKKYPPASYVVKTAQAFRPHILDMFEPQDHPDDIPYPGGPPIAPYDTAGWTLAYQMAVQFDRILDGFDGPFERIEGFAKPPAGVVAQPENAVGFLLSHNVNDAFIASNRLLKDGEQVQWLKSPLEANGKQHQTGTIYIPKGPETLPKLQSLAEELGLTFEPITNPPTGDVISLRPVRIGLWDRYGGSMPSGWVRWILEQFEFEFEVVYAPTLDRGNLAGKYDVLIFVSGSLPRQRTGDSRGRRRRLPDLKSIPEEFHDRIGRVSVDKTLPKLKKFLEEGGTMLTIGSATSMASHLGLPIANALVERQPDGTERPLDRGKYYVPGSVLRVRVDNTNPLAYGLAEQLDVYFQNSPVFRLRPDARFKDVRPVAWFDSDKPLRSGWAWGQHYLKDGVAVIEADVGKGTLFMFGPEITFRAQPHGTFKFLFNAIYYGPAKRRTPERQSSN